MLTRKEKKELIRQNKNISRVCPYCRKRSMFVTDINKEIRCILCKKVIPVKTDTSKLPSTFIIYDIRGNVDESRLEVRD